MPLPTKPKIGMSYSDKKALFGLLLAILVGLCLDLGPGTLLWLFLHPTGFWQRLLCAVVGLSVAGAMAVPVFMVGAFIVAIFVD